MDLSLTVHQQINAILHLTLQNNLQLKVISKALIETIAEFDETKADKIQEFMNASYVETHEKTLAHLKSIYGDVGDIDISDIDKD